MSIAYRKALIYDAELIVNARLLLLTEDSGFIRDEERIQLYENNLSHIQSNITNNTFISYLAFDGDSFVGTCSACLYSVLPGRKLPNGKHAYIQNVYVSPSYRGNGIAKKLVKLIISEVKQNGYNDISLHATDMGKLLFEKCGFTSENKVQLTSMKYQE
jgi:Acetyltransferases